jgi:multicomponent Na+:H+ antiporter subunit D
MELSVPSLIILIPFFGGAAAFILGMFRLRRTAASTVAIALAAALLFSLKGAWEIARAAESGSQGELVAGGWLPGVGIVLRYQGVSAILPVLIFFVALLILLHGMAQGERRPIFVGVYAISLGGMIGVVLSADLFNLFVFFEVLSLSAAILIAYDRTLPAMQAAFRYLLVATLSISLYLLGLFILYRLTGELSFPAVAAHLRGAGSGGPWRLAMVLLFGAVATRVALVPFHGWLPEAHGYAPTAVSALLSGLMLKAGFIAFWHLLQLFPGTLHLELLAWVGGISALVGAAAALLQEDAKRLLAYSSVSQLGYIAAAAGAGAFAASFYHILSHAFYKSLLFLIVGGWVHRWGVRSIEEIRKRAGRASATGGAILERALFVLGVAAIVGLPPFSAFLSKGLMGQLMKDSPVYLLIQVTGYLTAAALLKLGLLTVPSSRRPPAPGEIPGESGSPSGSDGEENGSGGEENGSEGEENGSGGNHASAAGVAGAVSLLILVLLFLPTLGLGVASEPLFEIIRQMDSGIRSAPSGVFAPSRLLGATLPVVGGGVLLFLLRRRRVRAITAAAGRLRLGVDGSMALVALGTVVIYAVVFYL